MIRIQPRFVYCAVMVVIIATLQGGCADCDFTYHVKGTLIDASSKQSLDNAKVAVEALPFEPSIEQQDWPGFSFTDSDGNFYESFGVGPSWGFIYLFGIPLRLTPAPIPPELDSVVLAVQRENGSWHIQKENLEPNQQTRVAPAERWIDLGTIIVNP